MQACERPLGGALGTLAGAITAPLIDDLYLGKVPPPPESTFDARILRSATLFPYVDRKCEAYGLSLAGAFRDRAGSGRVELEKRRDPRV